MWFKNLFKRKKSNTIKQENKNITTVAFVALENRELPNKSNFKDYLDDKFNNYLDYVMAGYHFGSIPTSLKGFINMGQNYFLKSEKAKEYNTEAIKIL